MIVRERELFSGWEWGVLKKSEVIVHGFESRYISLYLSSSYKSTMWKQQLICLIVKIIKYKHAKSLIRYWHHDFKSCISPAQAPLTRLVCDAILSAKQTLTSCLLLPVAVFSSSSSSCTLRCSFGKGVSFFARYAQNSVGFFSSGSNETGCLASLVISEPADKPRLWDAHPSPVSATNRRDIWSSSQQDVPPTAPSCGLCFAIELVPELVLTLL